MDGTLATAKDWIPVLLFAGALITGLSAFIWRYYQIRSQHAQILNATAEIREAVKTLAERQSKTSNIVMQLEVEFRARDKDSSKIEGKIELLAEGLSKSVGALQEVSGSLDGVWRTLQMIFPEKVPKRASDRS